MALRARPRGSRGFTLLELLITLSVTTIGLVGLLSLHVSITRGNDGASRSAEAQQIAVTELESLRTMSLDPLRTPNLMKTLTGSTDLVFPTRPHDHPATGRNGMKYNVRTIVTALPGLSANLIKIRVVVSWTEEGAQAGANGGQLDHAIPLEVVRTLQEVL
ncbi:MAG TPA: prepilin-type N-terminal cleavage/methylation domain-containing protein [Kofleriaceae bacterium]|nr:prepilin-type N-terminal cleavage/methylation domain-containing protein [Kofleriaceae bacterium]